VLWQAEVAYLQLLHTLPYLFHHAGELVAEGHPHSGVRDGTVVQVQDLRHGLLVDADPQRPRQVMATMDTLPFVLASIPFPRRANGHRPLCLWLTCAAPGSIACHAQTWSHEVGVRG
jgi:hypothetical protein